MEDAHTQGNVSPLQREPSVETVVQDLLEIHKITPLGIV